MVVMYSNPKPWLKNNCKYKVIYFYNSMFFKNNNYKLYKFN